MHITHTPHQQTAFAMTKLAMKTKIFTVLTALFLALACITATAADVEKDAFDSPAFTPAPIELDPTVKSTAKSLNLGIGLDSAPEYVAPSDLSLRLRKQWCRRGYKMCIYKKLCRVVKVMIRVCIKKYPHNCLRKTCCQYVFRYRSVRKCHWVTVRCYKYFR